MGLLFSSKKKYSFNKENIKFLFYTNLFSASLIGLATFLISAFSYEILPFMLIILTIIMVPVSFICYLENKSTIKELTKKYKGTELYKIIDILYDSKYKIPNIDKLNKKEPFFKEKIGDKGYIEYHYHMKNEPHKTEFINISFFNNKDKKAIFVLQFLPSCYERKIFYDIASKNEILKEDNKDFLLAVKKYLLEENQEKKINKQNERNTINFILQKCNYIEKEFNQNSIITNLKNNINDFICLESIIKHDDIIFDINEKILPEIDQNLNHYLLFHKMKNNEKSIESIKNIENLLKKYSEFLKESINDKTISNIKSKLDKTETNLKIEQIYQNQV